jgi:Clp amino terminal domain, pathogenicity island component
VFERYTEKARRVIFFSRYEASQYGSPYIETEHLLLGLVREDRSLVRRLLPSGAGEKIRAMIDARLLRKPSISTSVDLPLADGSKRILSRAAKEADELEHIAIGTGHLLLATLHETPNVAAAILQQLGTDYTKAREFVSQFEFYEERSMPATARRPYSDYSRRRPAASSRTINIHHVEHDLEFIRVGVVWCRGVLWHWTKKAWRPQDIVVTRSDGRISFDLSLAEDSANFQLVQNGWNHDACTICGWRLYAATEPERSNGYTNGRVWVCTECYEKFLQGSDYFATSHPEIT